MNRNGKLPRIGSAAVLEKNGKALLGKRSKEPENGEWVLPSGRAETFMQSKGIAMIKSTFVFVPGIGTMTENNLWRQGILSWDDWEGESYVNGLGEVKRRIIEDYLTRANRALDELDGSFFAAHFPRGEYWKLYGAFPDKTLFLDIETTGLSQYYDKITLIGTFDGKRIKTFVRGNNLGEIVQYLQDYQLLVTFNGKLFDMPFIKKEFPEVVIPPVHIDLRYLLRSVGMTGPLKEIEKKLGIRREECVQEVNGREATVLWRRFLRGENEAIERLLLYNIYDTLNLQSLLNFCCHKKVEEVEAKIKCGPRKPSIVEITEYGRVAHSLPSSAFDIPMVATKHSINGSVEVYLDGDKWLEISRDKIERKDVKIESLIGKIRSNGYVPISVGIDLSGSEGKASGICVLQGNKAYLDLSKTDAEIIAKTVDAKPAIISIDSPLSLPKGRCCTNDSCECRIHGITRECERTLKKRGVNSYPCLIGSMQKLTMRGIKLARLFRDQGQEVIESYPGAAQDILGFPRKRVDLRELEIDLTNMGIKPFSNRKTITHDEIDALTSAVVGYFYLSGNYEALGNEEERYLIIPNLVNG